MNGWGSVSAFLVGPRARVQTFLVGSKRRNVRQSSVVVDVSYGTVLYLFLPEFTTLVYSGFNGNCATACVCVSVCACMSVQDLSPYMHDCRYFIHCL